MNKLLRKLFKVPAWEHRIPDKLLYHWRVHAAFSWWAALAAFFTVPFAVFRAQRVDPATLPEWAVERYKRILGEVPRDVFRLRENQQWMETHDDPYLPAGLYEQPILFAYLKGGWRWAAIRWLWRNRAYSLAARATIDTPKELVYRTTGTGSMSPFVEGEWLCIAYERLESGSERPVAFEYSYTWKSWFGKHGQYRAGWKLRRFAGAAVGKDSWPPDGKITADGMLQTESFRPFQSP